MTENTQTNQEQDTKTPEEIELDELYKPSEDEPWWNR